METIQTRCPKTGPEKVLSSSFIRLSQPILHPESNISRLRNLTREDSQIAKLDLMDINPINICNLIREDLIREFPNQTSTPVTLEEKRFSSYLCEQIKAKIAHSLVIEDEISLVFADEADSDDEVEILYEDPGAGPSIIKTSQSSESTSSQTSSSTSSQEEVVAAKRKKAIELRLSEAKRREIYEYKQSGKSYNECMKKFKKPLHELRAICSSFESGGSNEFKLMKIHEFTKDKFTEARLAGKIIHYWHIQQWARERATQLGITNFKASKTFLLNFKRNNGICSRKITRFATARTITGETEILEKAREFVEEVNQ
uniref:HTH CENPB-type domain-containing protein n=1 Tax=Tetranychus urticae TaxID=32264 RepID=T1K182_TETUR